jgi:hypothetical protein
VWFVFWLFALSLVSLPPWFVFLPSFVLAALCVVLGFRGLLRRLLSAGRVV